jgi:hypothetical protein
VSISLDNILQSATGTVNATTATITFPSGTADGSTVVVCALYAGAFNPISTGFTRDHGAQVGAVRGYILRKSNVTAGENNYSFTGPGSAIPIVWFAFEIVGLHKTAPVEIAATLATFTGATSIASNTTGQSTIYEGLAFAFHSGENVTNSTVPTWSGQTGDFLEYVENSRVDGATATSAAVSIHVVQDIGTLQSTATASVAVTAMAALVVYAAAGTKRQPNLDVLCGFEFGNAAGRTTGNAANPPFDSSTGTVSVVSTAPRTGTYCAELTGSASISNIAWTSTGALSLYTSPSGLTDRWQYVMRFSVYFPTSLPGSDIAIAAMDQGNGTTGSGVQMVFRAASSKLGVQMSEAGWGIGTEVLSATTVAANTWYNIDLSVDMANIDRAGQYFADWYLDGVAQTRAVLASSTTGAAAAITQVRLGWIASSTGTVRFDDFCSSKQPGHFPLGDIGIYPLPIDPAGTLAVSGTAGNFNTFTANGTMAAWNATTARGAIDEIPPTISASADGLAQITVAASDYVEIPMSTRNATTNLQTIRGIRWYFCGWAASTTAATIGFRAFDGVAETVLFAAADPNFDNSTTAPAWVCRMHRTLASAVPYAWTQAELDALTARVGFSTSATPDIGVHLVMAEVAMRACVEIQVLAQDEATIYSTLDPDTGNIISLRLTAGPDFASWAIYTINSATVNRTAVAGGQDVYSVGAEANSVVSFISGGSS